MWTGPDCHQRESIAEKSRLAPRYGRRARKFWPFILFVPVAFASFSKPPLGPNEPPFKDITVWQATTDVVLANDRGDIDRSPAQFPKRFARLSKGTEVIAVDAGGGIKRPILKLRTVRHEMGYIYVDEFKRHFAIAKAQKQ
jgi:hypothetical protein